MIIRSEYLASSVIQDPKDCERLARYLGSLSEPTYGEKVLLGEITHLLTIWGDPPASSSRDASGWDIHDPSVRGRP